VAKINVPRQSIHSHECTKTHHMHAKQQSQRPVVFRRLKPMSSSTSLPRSSAFSALSLLRVLLFLAFVISTIGWAGHAEAIQNPGAILWQASPSVFVDSLYRGVLGRAPESQAVVNTWAGQVTGDPATRKRVFWAFVSSPEYQAIFQPSGPRTWSIWSRSDPREFVAAEHNPGGAYWHHVEGNLYQLWARALLGWYQAFGRV